MKLYGLIGFPLKHSYSAIMHNAAFQELGIDARYELFEIRPEGLEAEFKKLIARSVAGLNVTIPYKEKVVKLLDQVDPEARFVGAVNTIKVGTDKRLEGFNTDGEGFITHLREAVGFDPAGKKVSILGAGGAARALTMQLAKNGADEISLFDIEHSKAKGLVEKLHKNFSSCRIRLASSANALLEDRPDLLINATPVGMHKDDPLIFDSSKFHSKLVVYDLIYNPAKTVLLQEARRQGCSAVFNGLGMLLYQGALAFKIWLGVEPPIKIMDEALRGILSAS
jgi:shikimate dehydrogenase